MLDVGWSELLVIAIVLIVVVGPKDLPPMLRAFGKMTARLRSMAGEFREQFDAALWEADLDDVRKTIGEAQSLNPINSLREAMDPVRQTMSEIRADLQKPVVLEKYEPEAVSSAAAPAEPVAATASASALPVAAPELPAIATATPDAVAAPAAVVASAAEAKSNREKDSAAGKTTTVARKVSAGTKKDRA